MAKKKQSNLQKISNAIKVFLQFKEVLSAITVVILWLLAIWFSYQLAPVTQRIADLENKVLANEQSINGIKGDLTHIRIKVDNIEKRVDNIYEILVK